MSTTIIKPSTAAPTARYLPPPSMVERVMVVVTIFVLVYRLPMDWTLTLEDLRQEGNLRLAGTQLFLMGLGIVRVIGAYNHMIKLVTREPLVYVFCGLAFASSFWSADPAESLRTSVVLVFLTFYASYLVLRFPIDEILVTTAAAFWIGGMVNLAFVQLYPFYGLRGGVAGGDWDGVFAQKNALGFTAGLGLLLLLVAGRSSVRFRHVLYFGALVQAYLLYESDSKTMWVATVVSLALMVIYVMFRSRRTLRGAVMVGLLGGSIVTTAFVTANIYVLAQWLDKDITLTGRVPLWRSLMPVGMERFTLGHGYRAAFGGYFSPVHEVLIEHTWDPPSAHNGLLQVWLELGIVGVIVFVVLYIRAIRRAITYVQADTGVCGLWPLTFFSMALLISIAESGINYKRSGWLLFVVAVLIVSSYAKDRARATTVDLRQGPGDGGQPPGPGQQPILVGTADQPVGLFREPGAAGSSSP